MGGCGNGRFGPADDAGRQDVALMMFRMPTGCQLADSAEGWDAWADTLLAGAPGAYADADEVSGYAVEAMERAVSEGAFGVNAKHLNPGDPISRAELAAAFARFMDATDWTVPAGGTVLA